MFASKYKPLTQKGLFHKDIVNHIRKWLKNIEELSEFHKPVTRALLLCGPIGCGKSTTLEILLKGYNVINVNTSDLRTTEGIQEVVESIPSFKDVTLSNIGSRGTKCKHNLLVIDNIESCEKSIVSFIDNIHKKKMINIPIVMMTSNSRLKSIFRDDANVLVAEMRKPTLLELTKMTNDINSTEKLCLEKKDIRSIVEHSQFDIRQLLFMLEQKKYSTESIEDFLSNIETKHADIDLIDKLSYIFDKSKPYDMHMTDFISLSEPMTIAGGIFQNYSKNMIGLKNASDVADAISLSNLMQSQMFNDQDWSLYDMYAAMSCVIPCYYIKQEKPDMSTPNPHVGFKDISYNFINSYEEVKRVMLTLHSFKSFVRPTTSIDDFFFMAKIFITNISKLNEYFDQNKRGKNTSKQEKFDLCNNITDTHVLQAWTNIVEQIEYHNLYEIDVLKLDVQTYTSDELVMRDISRVDLRIFKRVLNIFTMDNSNKSLKSNVETALKYKLFKLLLSKISDHQTRTKQHNDKNIDTLVEDLDKIWNF
jgi:DNA polymerase III delta prime subunit